MEIDLTRIMRHFSLAATVSIFLFTNGVLRGDALLGVPNASVGNHLETFVKVALSDSVPDDDGVNITLRSADPTRLLISKAPDEPGAESIVVKARQGYRTSPEIWLQALDGSGTVAYTAEAPGFTKGTGTVTLCPSGIMIVGPLRGKKFLTTTGSSSTRLRFVSARLDSAQKFVEEQATAGGFPMSIAVTGSNDAVGRVVDNTVVIPAGRSNTTTQFKPAGEGETILSFKAPAGIGATAEYAEVTASVTKPGIVISDQLVIGQNLQVSGALALGEFAGERGVTVTLTSDDESKLLLSPSATQPGSKSITVTLAMNEMSTRYYLQALGKSGTVTYSATAPGFRKRSAIVGLAPSGIMITASFQGPPDEAQVLRADAADARTKLTMNLSKPVKVKLIVWTAQLDPVTHRAADITVQPVRAGYSLTVPLANTNPSIGKVATHVVIPGGEDHVLLPFSAKRVGSTEISVTTPPDFTAAGNSTSVFALVRK